MIVIYLSIHIPIYLSLCKRFDHTIYKLCAKYNLMHYYSLLQYTREICLYYGFDSSALYRVFIFQMCHISLFPFTQCAQNSLFIFLIECSYKVSLLFKHING